MKKSILVLAALVALITLAPLATLSAQDYEMAVQVTGKAEKRIQPDEIYVSITIRDGDIKNQNVDQIESRMKAALVAAGLDVPASLRVTSMSNTPKKRNVVDTRRSYELKVGDAATLDEVFEALGELNIAGARVTRVSHSRIDEFRSEVRAAAMKNAQVNASALAAAVGQTIGAAVWILDSGFYENAPVQAMTRAYGVMVKSAADYSPESGAEPLEMQDITLTYNVSAKFILNK